MGLQETWAKLIGVVLLIVGVLGFFMGDLLFGFGINALHNIVHLATGAIWAWAGFSNGAPTKQTNQWLGVIYILVGIIGFFGALSFLNVNAPDNWLHIIIGVIAAVIGWTSD